MPCRARGQKGRAVFRRLFLFVIRVSDKLHLGDDLDQLFADAALSLDGRGADVRRAGDHRVGVERDVGRGLVGIDVQTGGADLAAVERVKKRSLVDVGAAGGVDDDDAVLILAMRSALMRAPPSTAGAWTEMKSDLASSSSIST